MYNGSKFYISKLYIPTITINPNINNFNWVAKFVNFPENEVPLLLTKVHEARKKIAIGDTSAISKKLS